MLGKLREEICWVLIFLVTQLAVFSIYYRDFETKFFPVVDNFSVQHIYEFTDEYVELDVKFEKLRKCEFLGLRAYTPAGIRVRVDFLDKLGDQYHSRPRGPNVAGPWRIYNNGWSDLQVDVLHRCDIFGYTKTVMQRSDYLLKE